MSSRKIREIKLTNTLTGKREALQTITPDRLTMYSCGPTVYNLIHIGNLRGALVSDMFYRYFKRVGYEVVYVRNYTDVDDKIIKRGHEEGLSPEQVAKKYIQEVEKDFAISGAEEPTHKTLVTDHMPEIISMIAKIIENGKAYVADDGEVIYSISDFPEYGKLSHKNLEDLEAGSRVEVSRKKRNPLDFTLWKPAKPGEPSWESPWGKGRPGWHIECSAMASKWLGSRIDVHHGGEDLIFPHHENEIAQSEAATGEAPFVKYWLHHAFLTISKEKMSKSIGNVFTAREFLSRFGGEVARYLLLSVHYRSIIDFGEDSIDQALTGLQRIYEAKKNALFLSKLKAAVPEMRAESLWGGFVADIQKTRNEIDEAYANDFNTPGALASLFSLIREFNRVTSERGAATTPSAALAGMELIKLMEQDIGGVLGVGRKNPESALEELQKYRGELRATFSGAQTLGEEEIQAKIQERLDARKAKDFARADAIRDELESKGVILKDSPQGTTWTYK